MVEGTPIRRARGAERAVLPATCVAFGGFLGAMVGAEVGLISSCEPDYSMMCELAAPFAALVGLVIGATLGGFAAGMALRRTLLKPLSFVSAGVVLAIGFFLLVAGVSFPRSFRNLFVQNTQFLRSVAVVCAILGVVAGGIALLVERRRQKRPMHG